MIGSLQSAAWLFHPDMCEGVCSTCVNGFRWELACELLPNSSNASRGQAVLARGQAPHDKLKEPRRHIEVPVEENPSQERPEEPVYDGVREPLCLHCKADINILLRLPFIWCFFAWLYHNQP